MRDAKVLFYDPYAPADSKLVQVLKNLGLTVYAVSSVQEAWLLLEMHGSAISLAIINREGKKGEGAPGVDFVKEARKNPALRHLLILMTSYIWGEKEFEACLKQLPRANAYLSMPASEQNFHKIICELLDISDTPNEERIPFSKIIGAMEDSVYVPTTKRQSPAKKHEDTDTEILKMYLYLREKDIAYLQAELNEAHEEIRELKQALRDERLKSITIEHDAEIRERRTWGYRKEHESTLDALKTEIDMLRLDIKKLGATKNDSNTVPQATTNPTPTSSAALEDVIEDSSNAGMFIFKKKSYPNN